jgi:hypothetical protein
VASSVEMMKQTPRMEIDDAWPEAGGEGSGHLLVCCVSERPRKAEPKFRLLVTAKGAGPDGFLTVHNLPRAGAAVVDGCEGDPYISTEKTGAGVKTLAKLFAPPKRSDLIGRPSERRVETDKQGFNLS